MKRATRWAYIEMQKSAQMGTFLRVLPRRIQSCARNSVLRVANQ